MTYTHSLNCRGRLIALGRPLIMGILNITPDSFYADSRTQTDDDVVRRLHQMMDEGADMIDIGAYSSRPGADDVSAEEEMARLQRG